MPLAVDCKQIEKAFGSGRAKVRALRGTDLEVYSGELMMLVGPSGSGKTTLISVIAGILDRDGGTCDVFGQDYQAMSPSKRAAHRGREVGFVFQSFNLIPTLTIEENISIPLLITGSSRRAAGEKTRSLLVEVGLEGRAGSFPDQLSGGEQQRVAICRAIVHEPRLIVCDEPTSNLDHKTGISVMELLRQVGRKEGRAIIVVTHDSRIFSFADRIAILEDGRIKGVEESYL